MDYKFAGDLIKRATPKGALVAFSTMIADVQSASHFFLRYIGAPFVAIPLFVVVGCLLILLPNNTAKMLEGGLIDIHLL